MFCVKFEYVSYIVIHGELFHACQEETIPVKICNKFYESNVRGKHWRTAISISGEPLDTSTSEEDAKFKARPHTDAFSMRCVAIRHDASKHIRGRIETDRNAMHEKRIRVGRG